MNSLGQRIREQRIKKGLTQIELAKGLITPSMVSQIESDRARPSYKVLVGISARLDVPLEQLLKGVKFDLEYSSKYKMAKGMVQAKEYETAIQLLEDLLESAPHRIPRESLLMELSLCHIALGNVVDAENILNRLYQLMSARQDDPVLAAEVLLHLGKVAALKNDYPIAIFHSNRAWEELQTNEEIDADLHTKVLVQLATFHEKVGKVAEATKYYESALLLNQTTNEERGRAYLRLAEVYDRQKKFEQAEEYAAKAYLLLKEQANKELRQDMQHRLIMLQRGSVGWEISVQKLLSIAEQFERDGDKSKAGEIFADMALIYFENGEIDEARAFAEKARMALPDTGPAIGNVHRIQSYLHFHQGYEKKGRKALENAVRIFEQHGKFAELEEVTLYMCKYLSDRGEHREAFERMERFHKDMIVQLQRRGIVL